MEVRMADGSAARAYAVVDQVGDCAEGDRVVLNTTAVELGLGTGGWHVVHWNLGREELVQPGPDHVMKLRYTSLQSERGTAELDHPECDDPLDGIPVVACTLHSQLAPVVAGIRAVQHDARIVYVLTDGAALPLALSDTVAAMRDDGRLAGTVSAGSAFGGDLEAVGVGSALGLAAHTLDADVIVAGVGPGIAGTGTALGTSALDAVTVVDLAASLGGTPVLCVRVSDADERPRHRGLSHHTLTVGRLTHATPFVADPGPPGAPPADVPGTSTVTLGPMDVAAVDAAVVDPDHLVMGRRRQVDPAPVRAAVAAGVLAARLLSDRSLDADR